MRNFYNDEYGFVITSELVIVATVLFCGVIVGMTMVRDSVVQELGDASEGLGALNQSYNFRSIRAENSPGHSFPAHGLGSGFNDDLDDCDGKGVSFPVVCGKDDPSDLDTDEF